MNETRQKLLDAIAEMWDLHPEWRLGQMIQNVAGWARQPTEPIDPTWDVEDEEFLATMRGHIERRRRDLSEGSNGAAANSAAGPLTAKTP